MNISTNQKPALLSPPTSIINSFSDGGNKSIWASINTHGKQYLSGALTADIYKSVFSATGKGLINYAAVASIDATSRSLGLKIIIDGNPTPAFEAISSAVNSANGGFPAIGLNYGGEVHPQPVPYEKSIEIQVSSTITETDKVALYLNHEIR